MYSRRLMIVGVIVVMVALAILAAALFMLGDEENALRKAARFDGSAAGEIGKGGLVLVEGRVSAKNGILVHDFVDAVSEYQVDGGSWTILKMYRQPVLADLARGEILLASDAVCSEAKGDNVLMTGERTSSAKDIRYVGLRRGDPVTAIGTLSASAPTTLAVKYWYSGSAADHASFLASSRTGSYVFAVVMAIIGGCLFAWGFKGR